MALLQDIIFGLTMGSYLAIGAIGFTLVYGVLNMMNFAHAEFITFGGYGVYYLVVALGIPLLVALPLTVVIVAILAYVVARIFFTPLSDAGPIPLLLTAIGVGYILRNLIRLTAGTKTLFIERGDVVNYRATILGSEVFVSEWHFLVVGCALVSFASIHLLLTRARIGIAMKAMGDNESLARTCGVDAANIRKYVWLLSGGFAGLSGLLLAANSATSPLLGFDQILVIIAAAILGGAGSAYGAIIGAYIIGLTMSITIGFLPVWTTQLGTMFAFVVLIVVLLIRPTGIAGPFGVDVR